MEYIQTVRKWFQTGSMCAGLDLKDAFLHVPMSAQVNKFLIFKWKGKLYKWQDLPFGRQENLECFVGTFISTNPAVWKAPLHNRALQRSPYTCILLDL